SWRGNISLDSQQAADFGALPLFAFMYMVELLGQQLAEPIAEDADDHVLLERLGLDRLMRPAAVLEPPVGLRDGEMPQRVGIDLILGQGDSLPSQRSDLAFKYAPCVLLDVVASQIEVAHVEYVMARTQDRRDVRPEEASDLPVRRRAPDAESPAGLVQNAS